MPIKSCTRCGLKVLVDASQAASDTYVCPRCVSETKGSSPPSKPAPSGKRPAVKVLCPYCGASFSGSIPSRPAKGGCPVCQKELILLPDGTIQAAATFNLGAWQKQREAKKSESTPPAPAPAEALPEAADPIGGSTILDMGGPPSPTPAIPTLEEGPMEFPGGLGGETMLGMGGGHAAPPAPRPSIDEPEPEPEPAPEPPPEEPVRSYHEPEPPPEDDLGGETILDSDGPRAVELPEPSLEDKDPEPDLLRETMPGMDRPPSAESPVPEPTPPPIPEEEPAPALESEEAVERTVRDSDYSQPMDAEPPPAPEEEQPAEASMESAPELPDNLGGSTMLGIGGSEDMAPPRPEPIPTIEEPPPEAVPILAKDVAPIELPPDEPAAVEPPADAPPEEPAEAKPYVYAPIARVPRKVPGSMGPPPPPATVPKAPISSGPLPPPPPPPTTSNPVLGSDFRIATAPPPPKSPLPEATKAGVKTSQVAMPPAKPNLFRVLMAWILLLLPLVIGFLLYSMHKSSAVEKVIQKLSDEVTPGFRKMDEEIKKAITKPAEPAQK